MKSDGSVTDYFKAIILGLVLIATAILVYSPHFSYPYPFHGDEWHHITQAVLINLGYLQLDLEIGFQFVLAIIFKFTDPVLSYKFLPPIWAILGALALFHLVYKKTAKNFYLALLAIIFFASIKSNVNILGLWFFTPLSFSIPIIYWYMYLFTEGVEKKDRFLLWSSLAVMILILPTHALSLLFAIPILITYSLFHLKIIREKFIDFIPFFVLPPIGLLVFKVLKHLPWSDVMPSLWSMIIFKRGWAVVNVNNALTEMYSIAGYLLAIIGFVVVITSLRYSRRLLIFAIWPMVTLISIFFFRIFDFSPLVPHQRNLYYFALSLPPLSAIGLFSSINYLLESLPLNKQVEKKLTLTLLIIIIAPIIFFTFKSYSATPPGFELYQAIDKSDYEAIHYLDSLPNGIVMAEPMLSMAIFPIAPSKIPVTTEYWYKPEYIQDTNLFFSDSTCKEKAILLNKHKVKYVLTEKAIACGWELLYNQDDLIYFIK